ncbi:helicase-related protein [Janibacter anophelis]|uniref:helicase-related protein n=1 Tax=Janibacter anophelis TaxID=319054 RepID=UPI003F7E3A55
MKLEDVRVGAVLEGLTPTGPATVLHVTRHGADTLEVTYQDPSGLGQRMVFRANEQDLREATRTMAAFDADPEQFKIAAEAQRIRLAGLSDPMLAVATSDVQPLPHQIRAVYGEMLPKTPLRFLLADDPGAGKTIMAGLYIKELLLRDDVKRCLVIAPGGLVEQWQDELFLKFGLDFDILTRQMTDAAFHTSVFDKHPLLIARMDQLARNEDLQDQLAESEWDLVIVDEAHRMAANWWGGELRKTKRFQLGELVGQRTRHFLLMTATPHAGSEENYQSFLTLLDRDEFAGKYRKEMGRTDTSRYMRRMIKEDLLTFEGTPLFPERGAETVPYDLTPAEQELYERVTEYVREGMNRAQRLDGQRRNTVGFALTVLQRRLASSPAAIHESLKRRIARLEGHKRDLQNGVGVADAQLPTNVDLEGDYDDEYSAHDLEEMEDELVDAATAARTVEELGIELQELQELVGLAAQVRATGTDVKWAELRSILEDNHVLGAQDQSTPRKLIVFTEHKDTLDYLRTRITSVIGSTTAVEAIHGGVPRQERRRITEEFTKNPECRVLLATDAAGEGLNLQAAHLMVNYDLPWNPNRIEQRFGRIHRIGQTEVCRLWNLVAHTTREGQVFDRLLQKIEEQRKAYGGKVFDVLGQAFESTSLRSLLLDAIQYGDLPETRERMHQVVDSSIADGLSELLRERALASEVLAESEVQRMRRAMDEARARRLQPHYISMAFRAAFAQMGGRMARRETGRFEITHVPAALRGGKAPISTRYARVCFEIADIDDPRSGRADLLAPGHALHDAVLDAADELWGDTLRRGTVLTSADLDEPALLIGVLQEVEDGTGEKVARQFHYAYADEAGHVTLAGHAPYLDLVPVPQGDAADRARQLQWVGSAADAAASHLSAHVLPDYTRDVTEQHATAVARTQQAVRERLTSEVNRFDSEALAASQKEQLGQKVKESSESLTRKARDLEVRLEKRLQQLEAQAHVRALPPKVVVQALAIPLAWVEGQLPVEAPVHAKETKAVERRAVEAVLAAERRLGRVPTEQDFNNKGFDISSQEPDGHVITIEVKGRIEGAEDFFITHNEVLTGKNAQPRYRLALVEVSTRGPEHDQVRYVEDPFRGTELGGFAATGLRGDWRKTWAAGRPPH